MTNTAFKICLTLIGICIGISCLIFIWGSDDKPKEIKIEPYCITTIKITYTDYNTQIICVQSTGLSKKKIILSDDGELYNIRTNLALNVLSFEVLTQDCHE